MKETRRIEWIDVLKGLGIFLVVYGHITQPRSIYIYSFHVPLFFFISGYLFQMPSGQRVVDFVLKKVKNLVIPYFLFSIITVLLRVVSLYLENDHDWLESLKNIYLVFLGNAQNGGNDAVWFLTCLFITNLFFYFYLKIAHKRWHVITFLFFMLLFSYIDSILLISRSIYLPWKVDVSLMAIFFFGSGYLFRPYIDIMFGVTHNKYAVCLLITLLFVMNWYSARLNIFVSGIEHVKFVSAIYGNFLLFFISAFTGIATFVLISKVITSRVVRYFGYNSLTVLGFHKIIIFFIGKFICPNKILMISNLVTTFATFLFLIPIIFIFNKYIFDYLRNDRKIPNSVRSNI